jgi:hypothetical protein
MTSLREHGEQKKYEITEIAHPLYPWLHRIRALTAVNEQVKAGDLGGYVQSEENLCQNGGCWIYDRAVCCEDAAVSGEARICDDTLVKGSALVTGNARMFEWACAEGNCCIRSGEISRNARVAGEAVVSENGDGYSPLIDGTSMVYGSVSGQFIIKDIVLPGENYQNSSPDLFILENGKREVLVKERKLKPPKQEEKEKIKRDLER